MIAKTSLKSLQSFKAMPIFLTEIWRHQILTSCHQILTSCQIIWDVITPSIVMVSIWNFVNLFLLQNVSSCSTKSPSFWIGSVLEMALFRRLWRHNSTTQSQIHIKLSRVVDPIKIHILCENQEFIQTLLHFLLPKTGKWRNNPTFMTS